MLTFKTRWIAGTEYRVAEQAEWMTVIYLDKGFYVRKGEESLIILTNFRQKFSTPEEAQQALEAELTRRSKLEIIYKGEERILRQAVNTAFKNPFDTDN